MTRFNSWSVYTVLIISMVYVSVFYFGDTISFKSLLNTRNYLFEKENNHSSTHSYDNGTSSTKRQTAAASTRGVQNTTYSTVKKISHSSTSSIQNDNKSTYSMDSIPNANYSVEQALGRIPICNSGDRPRQRALLTLFHAWTQFAYKHQIQYWLAYGSAVGYVQRGGLLPHDLDVDIVLLGQDTQYLAPLADTNFSSVYELKVHPQWTIIGETKRSYHRSKGIHFVAPNARFINRKLRYHVDIWPIYDFHPDRPRNTTDATSTLTGYSQSYAWISSPKEWTFPLKPCTFSGLEVWCPAMPERIVTQLYGVETVNKTDTICVNGTWT